MIAKPQYFPKMTGEEYLAWEEQQEYRHEYIDGEIIAMTGGTLGHGTAYLNFYRALYPHLSQRGCQAYVADIKVQAKKNSRYFYPDLVVTCNPSDLKSRNLIQFPCVIVEVLSPSTETYDRTKKLKYYRQIDSLQEYVLVNPEEISVEIYRRGEGKLWNYYEYGRGEVIRLESLDFQCPIEVLYEQISLNLSSDEEE